MSRERGNMTPIPKEAYSLREIVSAATGSTYDIREALPQFPPADNHASWYLLGRELAGPANTLPAHTVWEDGTGRIFIRSIYLGNTTEWIGEVYGQTGATAAIRLDYSDFTAARKALVEKFPIVERRVGRYEGILATISTKHHVALSLLCIGEKGLATFYVVAKIETTRPTEKEKTEMIRLNVEALREAWRELAKYDRNGESLGRSG